MRFEQALQAMREGKRVRRADNYDYLYKINNNKIEEEIVMFYNHHYVTHIAFNYDDIMSEEWEVVEDEQKS